MALKTIYKNLFGNIISFHLLVLFLSVVGPTALFAQAPLKVGIAHNPPISFLDEKGMPQGVYVDTLNAIAQKENWALEYVFSQWAELLEKAKKGDIDLVAGIAKSPERDTFLDFTREAFAERWGVVYAPGGSPIRAMVDLTGKRVAVSRQDIHGGFFKQAAEAMGLAFTLVEEKGYEAAFQAVKDHRAEACVVSNGFGSANAGSYQLEATPLTFKPIRLVVAFPEGKHRDIADTIDAYLNRWKNEQDSVYLASIRRWLGAPRGQKESLAITPEQRAWLAAHPAIRVAFDGYFPPYSYLTDDGRVEGLAVDILKRLADRLSIRLDIHPVFVWKDLFDAAVQKEVDVVATLVQRPEREQWFAFTRPYIFKSLVVITRTDDETIREREDIAGKRIALVRGYQYVPRILQDFPTLKPYYVDTMLDGLNAVATGNADAAVTFFSAGRHLQSKYGIANLKFAAVYDRSSSLDNIGVRKDWPELAALLDKALMDIEPSDLMALQRKWNSDEVLLSDLQKDILSRQEKGWLIGLAVAAGLGLFAFLGVYAWSRALRSLVVAKTHALETELVEKSQMAAAIRESEEKFKAFSEQSPLGISLIGKDGRYKYTNPQFRKIFGYMPEDIPTGSEWFKKAFPDENDRTLAVSTWIEDQKQAGVGQSRPRVFSVTCKDGSRKEVQFRPVSLENRDQFVIYEDITKRKQAEEAILNAKKDWETIFQAIGHPALILDPGHRILSANRKALELSGLSEKEIQQKKCFEVFHESRKPPEDCPLERMRRSEQSETTEMEVEKAGGTFLVSCTPVFDGAGKLEKVIHIAMDITDRKALEAQLLQSQKMEAIGTLAGGVAHDFNNMLSVIMGYGELARERVSDPKGPSARALDEILNASKRAAELVKQLLGFARKQTAQPAVMDLNKKLESSRLMLERLIGEDIHLELVKSDDLWTVMMDPSQIDQITTNLAANSRDAIPDVGTITLATENAVLDEAYCSRRPECTPGEYVLLRFSDSGSGMDQKTKEKIFEPFFTTKEVGKGTGMGLAMVYGIVKQNRGVIEVESEPEKGTTFRIGFPRYRGKAASIEDILPETFKKGKEVILLVEDEAEILKLAQQILERQGYSVVAARLPSEAIALCEAHGGEVHLLVTDIVLPAMNGKDLSDRIRKLKPNIKTLFMSGYPKDLIAQRGIMTEEVHFLEKPFSIRSFTDKVREVIDS